MNLNLKCDTQTQFTRWYLQNQWNHRTSPHHLHAEELRDISIFNIFMHSADAFIQRDALVMHSYCLYFINNQESNLTFVLLMQSLANCTTGTI